MVKRAKHKYDKASICEVAIGGNYSDEEIDFMLAVYKYQKAIGVLHLDVKETLTLAYSLGYRLVGPGTFTKQQPPDPPLT